MLWLVHLFALIMLEAAHCPSCHSASSKDFGTCLTVMTCADYSIGSAASRPEKRIKLEVDLEPAPFGKRVSHPPFARGGYNSEEWVFDDEDDDDLPAEQHDYGDQDDARHYSAGAPDDSIRSLEVRLCF